MHLNISPNPIDCTNVPGGVNSVVADHALGFLAAGYSIREDAGVNIAHALAQHAFLDVYHCHGLYPIGKGYFDASYTKANNIILQNALRAKMTICISEFSANILRHKLHIDPHVTRNGIWIKDYKSGGSPSGPVLFPKANLDANARPDDVLWLAANSTHSLLSIAKIAGVKSTGPLDRKSFLSTLRDCSIYLGTTKENNSMATMEAMISGVPVVGYDIGFNSEWLISGNGCELVAPGDRNSLKDAIAKVKADWRKYNQAAREYAEIFNWQPVIDELLGVYEKVYKTPQEKSVSIIIPCHNYETYLDEAIQSALAQTIPCEVIVVDDKSTDNSLRIAKSYGNKITVIANEINLGVAETRNKGIAQAKGEYIICLDADDKLHPQFAELHLAAFHTNADAIAYAPINIVDEQGNTRNQRLFYAPAKPEFQAKGRNQIPSACMFRRSFWVRAGGYDKRYTPAEDANLWLKIFSLGGKAVRAGSEPLMDYRAHGNSLSAQGFPNWWSSHGIRFDSPITERDTSITVILDSDENAKEVLWQLENQEYKNWSAQLRTPNGLSKTFPWLNKATSRQKSILQVTPGMQLPPGYLLEFAQQTPPWIREPRSLSLS